LRRLPADDGTQDPQNPEGQRDCDKNGRNPANAEMAESVRKRGKYETQQSGDRHRDEHFATEVQPCNYRDANNDCVCSLSPPSQIRAGTAERISCLSSSTSAKTFPYRIEHMRAFFASTRPQLAP
jgi:hypothetical protein